ncbi:MAG TPA: nucleotidyltransferase [Clostridiales bacterium]|nr:nucleotidyltransferase [Clostridiales bacterium]
MVYSIDELSKRIAPIAMKYNLRAVYIFGSYARNEATENSDVDVLIDRTDSKVKNLFDMGGLYNDLCESIGKEVDLVTTQTLEQESTRQRTPWFVKNVRTEMLKIYE